MTVAELIRILQTLDPQEEVVLAHPYLAETATLESVTLEGPAQGIPVLRADF